MAQAVQRLPADLIGVELCAGGGSLKTRANRLIAPDKSGGRRFFTPPSYLDAIRCSTEGKSKQSGAAAPSGPLLCVIKNANPVAALNPAKELHQRGGCCEGAEGGGLGSISVQTGRSEA